MTSLLKAAALSASLLSLSPPALAQEAGSVPPLPAGCPTGDSAMMNMDESMQAPGQEMTEFHSRLMAGMAETDTQMMQAMMANDADVAFACAMIPHHRAAIDMAKVELDLGDAGPMRDLAERIIAAQEQEIAELTMWIEEQAQ